MPVSNGGNSHKQDMQRQAKTQGLGDKPFWSKSDIGNIDKHQPCSSCHIQSTGARPSNHSPNSEASGAFRGQTWAQGNASSKKWRASQNLSTKGM